MADMNGKTKYYVLLEQLKGDIISGKIKPGDKLPSENQLSEDWHVSRHTVRKALDILAQDGYIHAVHGKGTFCSEHNNQTKNSGNVAVITTYISDYIFPRVIQGIDHVLTKNNYSIILKNTGNSRKNEAKCLEDILTKDIDGLIIEPSKSQIYCRHRHLYDRLDAYGIPYIFIQGIYPQMEQKPHIVMDDCQGMYLLTKHLTDLGHRSIAGIFKADDYQGQERHKGYVRALQEAGQYYDPDKVIWFHTEDRALKPVCMLKRMLEHSMYIDGIACYNDQIAYEIIRVLQKRGIRIPEDISVAGYDNSFIASSGEVKLTTIAHPQERLGEMAAELLLEEIHKIPSEQSRIPRLIQPELVIRKSCINRL